MTDLATLGTAKSLRRSDQLIVRGYSRVSFSEGTAFESGKFDPCTQLSGRVAEFTFIMVENKPYDGEIQSVEIE